MKKTFLIGFLAFILAACTSLQSQTSQSTVTSTSQPATVMATFTATEGFTPTASETPTQTLTPGPTFPLELTQAPGIYETATAYAMAVTQDYLNNQSLIGPMADLLQISQYFDPVGTPLASWHDIPILSQAIAGQEFKSDIYSYKANATLNGAAQFYNRLTSTSNCFTSTGTAGTGSNASHSINMICLGVKGFNIVLTSFDNDTSHVIVVINKVP